MPLHRPSPTTITIRANQAALTAALLALTGGIVMAVTTIKTAPLTLGQSELPPAALIPLAVVLAIAAAYLTIGFSRRDDLKTSYVRGIVLTSLILAVATGGLGLYLVSNTSSAIDVVVTIGYEAWAGAFPIIGIAARHIMRRRTRP
jgi:hypothetical protein